MDEFIKIGRFFVRKLYRFLWQLPYQRRGFVFAVYWALLWFTGLNSLVLLFSIGEAPAGAYFSVGFLWLCVYLLKRRVDRGPRKRGERMYELPHRR